MTKGLPDVRYQPTGDVPTAPDAARYPLAVLPGGPRPARAGHGGQGRGLLRARGQRQRVTLAEAATGGCGDGAEVMPVAFGQVRRPRRAPREKNVQGPLATYSISE